MATKYEANLGAPFNRASFTESAVVDAAKAVTVVFNEGVLPSDQVRALTELQEHLQNAAAQGGPTFPEANFSAASQSVTEEATTVTVTVTLSTPCFYDVSVPYTLSGTATGSGTDYSIEASPLVIPAGDVSGTVTVTVAEDLLDEDNETAIVTMGTPTNASKGSTDVHTVTITDDDPLPEVNWTSASQASVGESGTLTVTAEIDAVSGRDVTVPFVVTGTATDPDDYTITASPVVISAGETTVDITITIASDMDVEGDETVILTMGTPTNATKGSVDVHTATITDDD